MSGIRVADWKPGDPVLVGLLLLGLDVADVTAGDILVSADQA